jgi:hypothetical protein
MKGPDDRDTENRSSVGPRRFSIRTIPITLPHSPYSDKPAALTVIPAQAGNQRIKSTLSFLPLSRVDFRLAPAYDPFRTSAVMISRYLSNER